MIFRSHTLEEISSMIVDDPSLKIFILDTGTDGQDDVMVGRERDEILADLKHHYDWDQSCLPVGWTLWESSLEELE